MVYPCKGLNIIYCYFLVLAMENAARKTKTKMTAAERKRKQRAKAETNMIEEEKRLSWMTSEILPYHVHM